MTEDDTRQPAPPPDLPLARRWARRLGKGPLGLVAFALAAALALTIAWSAAHTIERRATDAVGQALMLAGLDWAEIGVDGLQVRLSGTAPTEAARAKALAVAGGVVDARRVIDEMAVTPATPIRPPRFSVEMLRNDEGIQLIGLMPEGASKERLAAAAQALLSEGKPADMLATAAFAAPEGWDAAIDFGAAALALLPRAKISVSADGVAITAITDSAETKKALEDELAASAPKGLPLRLAITAPRPVLTPFTLRFVIDGKGARFDACSADTRGAGARILAAGQKAGAAPGAICTVGMGVPSPRWAEAAVAAIAAVGQLARASVTFSDADVTVQAGPGVTQADFDRVVGELRNALPDVFSLQADLEVDAAAAAGPAEFTAVLAAKGGQVELSGLVPNDLTQDAVEAFAKARFGLDKVRLATRIDPGLPAGWPRRALVGLAALAELHDGRLLVQAERVVVRGNTGSRQAQAKVAQVLSEGLGQGQTFEVDVTYQEALDPLALIPTPEECLARVDQVMAKAKIGFDPGSAEIAGASAPVMDALAQALTDCGALRMEIGGHTDAQGSEGGNKALSQARAEAVLLALQGRRVDISAMRAVGYGESHPVADNETEAGREANRRIAFSLIGVTVPAREAGNAVEPGVETGPATGGAAEVLGDGPQAPKEKTETPKPRPKG